MSPNTATAVMDVVPERFAYRDEGCELFPSCLSCPLPRCKYDDPGWYQREQRRERDSRVMEALGRGGMSVSEAASRFALSQRTIFRIMKRADREGPTGPALGQHARAAA